MKTCSCQGGNPNCSKCGGWGVLDEISFRRTTESAFPPLENSKKKKKKKKKPCPFCEKKYSNVRAHVIVKHPSEFEVYKNTESVKSKVLNTRFCHVCGSAVKQDNMEKHLRVQHGIGGDSSAV